MAAPKSVDRHLEVIKAVQEVGDLITTQQEEIKYWQAEAKKFQDLMNDARWAHTEKSAELRAVKQGRDGTKILVDRRALQWIRTELSYTERDLLESGNAIKAYYDVQKAVENLEKLLDVSD